MALPHLARSHLLALARNLSPKCLPEVQEPNHDSCGFTDGEKANTEPLDLILFTKNGLKAIFSLPSMSPRAHRNLNPRSNRVQNT